MDEEALTSAYEAHGPKLLAFIRAKMGPGLRARLESRDILQATFMKSFQHRGDFEGSNSQSLVGWLMRIAENEIRDRADFHGRRQRDAKIEEDVADHGELARRSRSILSRLILDEQAQRVEAALDSLSDAHREVILLRMFQEMPFREIARAIGKSEDASRMLYARAMTALTLALSRVPRP